MDGGPFTDAPLYGEEQAPPANLELEMALLGAVLVDHRTWDRVIEAVPGFSSAAFFDPYNRTIAETIERFAERGQRIDAKMVAHSLGPDSVHYIGELVGGALNIIDAPDYARTLCDLALARDMVPVLKRAMAQVHQAGVETTARDQLTELEAELFQLAERGNAGDGPRSFVTAAQSALQRAQAAAKGRGMVGLSTGIKSLDELTGGLAAPDLIILAGRPGMGKAQPLGAKVLLADGTWAVMGSLKLGDELASIDGASSRVVGIYPQGRRKVYRVTFGDGRSTRACGEHLWDVSSCKFSSGHKIMSTEQLSACLQKERYKRRISVPLVSGHFGADEGLLIDPWLLGAFLSNGTLHQPSLSFSTADAATFRRMQAAVGHDCVGVVNDYDSRIRHTEAAGLYDGLASYGLRNARSADKFVPPAYLRASRESRLELLRGLLDTDGWVETHGSVRFATASPRLAQDVQALVRSLGGICTINVKSAGYRGEDGERRECLPSHVCNISHPDRRSFFTLLRKQRRCSPGMQFRPLTVVSIEEDGEEDVQCIAVSHPSQLYVTDDYIVTHNTKLGSRIAFNVARQGHSVIVFSLEMSGEQLATAELSSVAEVDLEDIRRGRLKENQWDRLVKAQADLGGLPIHVDDTPAISPALMRARARRHKRRHGLDLIMVDYLQLMRAGVKGNRNDEITVISQSLKALAKELDVPVLALSQLSRGVEQREDKRPMLSDLRDSGSIEQDADMVWFLFRPAYYLREPKRGEKEPETEYSARVLNYNERLRNEANLVELNVAKFRQGQPGTVHLFADLATSRFGELEDRY